MDREGVVVGVLALNISKNISQADCPL